MLDFSFGAHNRALAEALDVFPAQDFLGDVGEINPQLPALVNKELEILNVFSGAGIFTTAATATL